MNQVKTLSNWKYRKANTAENWKSSRENATTTQIQADLLANGEIPDFFLDLNAKKVQWAGEIDWEYRTEIKVTERDLSFKHQILKFEGLDTIATVYLNDAEILKTDNMFTQYEVDVTGKLNLSMGNELRIYFKSALLEARRLEMIHGKGPVFNGETARTQVRKAQYGWGWDWADSIMTCGPWQPVKLECFNSRITDVYAEVDASNLKSVRVNVHTSLNYSEVGESIKVTLMGPKGDVHNSIETALLYEKDTYVSEFQVDDPQLWYPRGSGEQPLYTVEIELLDEDEKILQAETKTIGLRKVELVQEPYDDQKGTSFYFKINDVPVYCAGSDWIPAHSLPVLITEADYEKWLQILINGNQNMVRIWGGGYYESEAFYSECDRLGVLVWQDFMFACGAYPGYPEFIKNVSKEVEHQLRRLRNHCCLTIFAGNNEDYQVAEQCGLEWDPDDHSGDYSKSTFPARTIYEVTLPDLVAELVPAVPYHPGSPWGGNGTTDPTVGDIHQWNVWHGSQEKYQDWYKLGGRFVSEFGMEALPDMKTYLNCITNESELYPQSESVDWHNKSDGFERRLALYVMENIKVTKMDLDSYIYATQLMQSECLSYAYKCWRRNWKGEGKRYSGGAIVWQLNDCCPMASWAIVDFYYRPKLAYYAVKRESAPINIGLYRKETDLGHGLKKFNVDIWGVNSSLKAQNAVLTVQLFEVASGKVIDEIESKDVVLAANQTTEFYEGLQLPLTDEFIVVFARLEVDGKTLVTAADWPQPLKYLKFPERKVEFKLSKGQIVLKTNRPVKGVQVTVKNRDVYLEDNGFDIFPGEPVVVKGDLLETDEIAVDYYQK